MNSREYEVSEIKRKESKGLHIKEYIYNEELLQVLAAEVDPDGKIPVQEIKNAVVLVFDREFGQNLSGENCFKVGDMVQLLKRYFYN